MGGAYRAESTGPMKRRSRRRSVAGAAKKVHASSKIIQKTTYEERKLEKRHNAAVRSVESEDVDGVFEHRRARDGD